MKRYPIIYAALAIAALTLSQSASAISIIFDYSYDSSGFFTGVNASRQTILNQAAGEFTSRIQDHLTAITSSGPNQFNVSFNNPSSGAAVTLNNYSVADNALIVYVGAQNLGGPLGEGGPGGYSISGTSAFLATRDRGQTGALSTPPTDFGPWGGAITFNSAQANWYFGSSDPISGSSVFDFYSVAVHELGHVLGFGTAPSFGHLVVAGTNFTGASASAAYGGSVPMADPGHWKQGLTSTVGGVTQEVVMDPSISNGQRKHFTELDFAGLRDTGWQVSAVPVPAAVWLFASGLAGLFGFARRRMA